MRNRLVKISNVNEDKHNEVGTRLSLPNEVTEIYAEFNWYNTSYAEKYYLDKLKDIFDALELSEYIKFEEEDNGKVKITRYI